MSETNSASSSTILTSSSSPMSTLQTTHIHHLISVKLDQTNYLLWLTQFKPLLKGYDLEGYADGTLVCPPRTLSNIDTTINPTFLAWTKQYQIMFGWLLSSLSESVLAQVVGLDSSRVVWYALDKQFASKSRARKMQIRRELQTI
ncbi:hypothetical protein GIB67_036967 [Kingdonia uniflora]|uniref:Retrotransposon Copia-like N-terminal domain-containing protein n=1 Tax=Kingdonia uniflora TaxID=39325 RepID=A0A7J7NVW6_9MAGN|nr:hypothetical protein GIB67_036967 [Kingdonia uniflora]